MFHGCPMLQVGVTGIDRHIDIAVCNIDSHLYEKIYIQKIWYEYIETESS
jgi:hypothetical protein